MFTKWSHVLGLLGSGGQTTVEDILACKELFTDEPYNLSYLSRNHVVSVALRSFDDENNELWIVSSFKVA